MSAPTNRILCRKVLEVTEKGIMLDFAGGKIFIDFDDCAKNCSLETGKDCKCVATRDITKWSFTFYTYPKTDVIFKRGFFKNLFAGRSAESEFLKLQKIIVEAGYTSFDLS